MMSVKKVWVVAVLVLWVIPAPADAKIYRWVDESGVVHFGDEASQVQRKGEVVRPGSSINLVEGSADMRGASDVSDGKTLYLQRCSACHTLLQEEEDKVSLLEVVVDHTSGFPRDVEQILKELKRAASGAFSDMDRLEIGEDELRRIAEYLHRAASE